MINVSYSTSPPFKKPIYGRTAGSKFAKFPLMTVEVAPGGSLSRATVEKQ